MFISSHSWRLLSIANALRPRCLALWLSSHRRSLLTLAIETSCDDTCVAILSKQDGPFENIECSPSDKRIAPLATLHFHQKVTADNSQYSGIHPLTALESHQENLASLIATALHSLPDAPLSGIDQASRTISIPTRSSTAGIKWVSKRKPDFVSVTRGPGMRSSLAIGLDTAKGLAVAWQIPLVGVNHMQAHALTPRLVSALAEVPGSKSSKTPEFPFLSLLVSGGHTLVLRSKSITEHRILANTIDIAVGDLLDKIARAVCPPSVFARKPHEIMYGRLLEEFAFPQQQHEYSYGKREEEASRRDSRFGWSLPIPFARDGSAKSRAMDFSFTGLGSAVESIAAGIEQRASGTMSVMNADGEMEERVELAREAMRVTFEHLASRVVGALNSIRTERPLEQDERFIPNSIQMKTEEEKQNRMYNLVVSGGVASNQYLRTILHAFLAANGWRAVKVHSPPADLCTDNAAMIAWTGIEMYAAGWESSFLEGGAGGGGGGGGEEEEEERKAPCGGAVRPLNKWSVDANAADGGILGVGGWTRRERERGKV